MFGGFGELVRTPQFEPRPTQPAETARSERSERATPSRGEERSDESSLRARRDESSALARLQNCSFAQVIVWPSTTMAFSFSSAMLSPS